MSKRIYLDIETLPPDESVREEMAWELNSKRSLGELEINEAEIESRFRDLALQGERGRLLCIGLVIEENRVTKQSGVLGRERQTRKFHLDEARTLRSFWNLVEGFREGQDLFIGHNILDFDLLFLYKRSCIHGIKPSINLSFRRYQSRPIFDTMWEWTKWHHRISLHDVALALGLQSPKEPNLNGWCVYDLYRQEKHEEIAQYCMRDVMCVREVFYRLQYEAMPPAAYKSPMVRITPMQEAQSVLAVI